MARERTVSETPIIAIATGRDCLSGFVNFPTPRKFLTGDSSSISQSSSVAFSLAGREISVEPAGLTRIQIHSTRPRMADQELGLLAFAITPHHRPDDSRLYLIPESPIGIHGAGLGFNVDLPEPIGSSSRLTMRLPLDAWKPEDLTQDDLMGAILARSVHATKGGVFPLARFAWLALQANRQTPASIQEMLEDLLRLENWRLVAPKK